MIMKLCDTTPIFYAVCGCKWKWRTNPPIHTHPQLPYLSRQLFEFAKALAAIVAEAEGYEGRRGGFKGRLFLEVWSAPSRSHAVTNASRPAPLRERE
jgi:hypothetical protein